MMFRTQLQSVRFYHLDDDIFPKECITFHDIQILQKCFRFHTLGHETISGLLWCLNSIIWRYCYIYIICFCDVYKTNIRVISHFVLLMIYD